MPKKKEKPEKPKSSRPRRNLHGHVRKMRDTIELLLQLPQPAREQFELAENYTFTMDNPAPGLELAVANSIEQRTILATLGIGSVEAAELMAQKGYNTAVLNFAHGNNCGGGFEHAVGSQEEDIFRKTSLFLSLWPHRRSDDGPGVLKRGLWIGDYDEDLPRKEPWYGHTECGGIYSPYVCIARELQHAPRDQANHLIDIANITSFSVLTLAAQHVGFQGAEFNPKLLAQKCRSALWMAASHGHDCVVLGAFGCGYFNNPTDVVAETFRSLLADGCEFAKTFRVVVFAIIGGNHRPFSERFPMMKPDAVPSCKKLKEKQEPHEMKGKVEEEATGQKNEGDIDEGTTDPDPDVGGDDATEASGAHTIVLSA